MMIFLQSCLVVAIATEILNNLSNYAVPQNLQYNLFLSKFVVTIAVHLNIYPVLNCGFRIMKFVNNHPHLFDQDLLCFLLGLIMLLFSVVFEFLNIVLLFSKASVYLTLGSYFALSIIIYLQKMYYDTVIQGDASNVLSQVFDKENLPKITWRNSKNNFSDR